MNTMPLNRYHYSIANAILVMFILLLRPFLLDISGNIYFEETAVIWFGLLALGIIILDFWALFLKMPAIVHRAYAPFVESAGGVFMLLWLFRILIAVILGMFVVESFGLSIGSEASDGDWIAQAFITSVVLKELVVIVYAAITLSPDNVAAHPKPLVQRREWLGDIFISMYVAFAYITVWETLLVKAVSFSNYSVGEFIVQGLAAVLLFGMMVLPLQILFIVEYFSRKNTFREHVLWWSSMIALFGVALFPVFTS